MIIFFWYVLAVTRLVESTTLPGPDRILLTAVEMSAHGQLGPALLVSFVRAATGAALGIGAGLVLGLLSGLSRLGEDIVDRPLQMVRTIPFTALVPLFILWFGLGELPKILLVLVGVLIPVYVNTFAGVRSVESKLVEVAQLYGLARLQISLRVLLPGALPSILVGLRFGLGLAWIAVIVAETVNSDAGIGFLLTSARQFLRTDQVMVCVAVYALLGLLTDLLVRAFERYALSWRMAFSGT